MAKLSLLILSLLFGSTSSLFAQDDRKENFEKVEVFQVENIALLNSTEEFGQRAGSARVVAGFIKAIEAEIKSVVESKFSKDKTPQNGLVAVAIRPDGSSKFWVDIGGSFHEGITSKLESALADVGTPHVAGGPVAFTINFQIWGGAAKSSPQKKVGVSPPTLPALWKEAIKGSKAKLRVPDELLPLVWPEKAGNEKESDDTFVPEGFVLQTLEPLGGSVLRPKDWHYRQSGSKQGVVWTISKEPTDSYITGVRIQLIVGIKELTGKTPEAFVKNFYDTKKKQSKVLSEREAMTQGGFTRIGLETEEPQPGKKDAAPFRIVYSCFWNDELDMAAITISGTTTDLWKEYQETFDAMAGLTLINLKKAKANSANSKAADQD